MNKTTVVNEIIADLGTNFKTGDNTIVESIYNDIVAIAQFSSNRSSENDEVLTFIVKKAIKSAYLSRGNEGMKSYSEGGISLNYGEIIDQMKKEIIIGGYRRVK